LPEYHESVAAGRLPVVRGYALDATTSCGGTRSWRLMCQGRLDVRCDRAGARHRGRDGTSRRAAALQEPRRMRASSSSRSARCRSRRPDGS
jgi:hypothetical protein